MYNRLLKFIDKNNLLNEFQFGFRNNYSTFMALIVLVDNLVTALNNGNCAVELFLDFQKAFDTVDHCILLDKLSLYGVRGIAHDWFYSYLSNRSQSVNYNDYESDLKTRSRLNLGPIIIFDLYQWLAFCFQVFHANSFCRWHKSFLYWTQSSWYCLPNKPGNQNNLFMGEGKQIICDYW